MSANTTAAKERSLETLPVVVVIKLLDYLDIKSLVSLENTSHVLANIVSNNWKKYCHRMHLTSNPTPLCTAWKVNKLSVYAYDKANSLCDHPVNKWKELALRCYWRSSYKCIICNSFIRDICGVNGVYFEHDILLCYPQCYGMFTLNVRADVVHLLFFIIFPLIFSSIAINIP